ncbi:hypothetical protein ACWCQN_13170 [Streptomyces sp. NPDC001984]
MTDHFVRPERTASSATLDELHRLCAEDYASTAHLRHPGEHAAPARRCPATFPTDPTACRGPVAVTVLDRDNAGADGCEYHAARLLAALDGGRVYALPDAPDGAAIRVFTAAGTIRGGEHR